MSGFESSTLWRISRLNRRGEDESPAGSMGADRPSLLSSTMQAELDALARRRGGTDALGVIATCLRVRDSVALHLQVDELIWPITLIPNQDAYRSNHDLLQAFGGQTVKVRLISVEPPTAESRDARGPQRSRPLAPVLWQLALHDSSGRLLEEIAGTAAYRALHDPGAQELPTPGALGPAVARLRKESAALRHIARWPGMSLDRATRLLNALYLTSNLIVTRGGPTARAEPGRAIFGHRIRRPTSALGNG